MVEDRKKSRYIYYTNKKFIEEQLYFGIIWHYLTHNFFPPKNKRKKKEPKKSRECWAFFFLRVIQYFKFNKKIERKIHWIDCNSNNFSDVTKVKTKYEKYRNQTVFFFSTKIFNYLIFDMFDTKEFVCLQDKNYG